MYESLGCQVKLASVENIGYSPGPAANVGECNAKCVLENLNTGLTGQQMYTKMALSPPLATAGGTVNCICMRNVPVTSMVAENTCSTPCPLNPAEKCGHKAATGLSSYSVYKLYDIESKNTPCKSCPTVTGAIAENKGATCYGGFYPPIAKKGYWSSPSDPTKFYQCLVLSKGCIGGVRYGRGEYGEAATVAQCGEGYQQDAIMCAACSSGYSAGSYIIGEGGRCVKCPHNRGGPPFLYFIIYLIMPFAMFNYWYPGLFWLISTFPVSFVVVTFFQITGALAGFSIKWNKGAKLVLKIINIINFDKTLFFFECSLPFIGKTYTFNFLLVVLLPFLYTAKYYGHMWYNHKYGDATATWNQFIKASLYHVNLLFLPILNQCLLLLSCAPLADGTYILPNAPNTKCFESDHLTALLLMPFFIIVIVIGWPTFIVFALHAGQKNNLLSEPSYAASFGWIYQRYEVEFFWWHLVVLAKKLAIILAKAFMFNTFWQTPFAAACIIGFLGDTNFCCTC